LETTTMPRGAAVIAYKGPRGIVYRVKYVDADGKQVQETVGAERDGVTRRQAEAELRERLVRVERKHYRKPKALTFGEWSRTWLEEGKRKRAWRVHTVPVYENVLRYLDDYFGKTRLGSIRPRDVSAYVNHTLTEPHPRLRKPLSAKTVGLHLSVLHDVLKAAVADELIDSNPAAGIARPKAEPQRWRILEPDEARRVAKAFTDARARAVFLTLALTGVRRSELRGLRWRHVSLTEGTLRVTESKSEEGLRMIQMPPMLVDVLADLFQTSAYKADTDYVFAHPTRGSAINAKWYTGRFREALTVAGVEGRVRTFHDMRHTALTNLALTPSASELVLMATVGHRSFATTKQYLQLAGRVFPEAAAGLQDRMFGGRKFYPSDVISDDVSDPEPLNHAATDLG
jgi:integrase